MDNQQLTASQVMSTELITIRESESIGRAAAEMRLADIRHLLVVDDDANLVGIVSNRDLFRTLGTGKRKTTPVSRIMSTDVLTVRPETSAREATAMMLDHKIGALPVVETTGKLIGVITETDFLRITLQVLGGEAQTFAAR